MIPLEHVADVIASAAPRLARIHVDHDESHAAVCMRAVLPTDDPDVRVVVRHDMSQILLQSGRTDVVEAAIRNFVVAVEHEMPLSWWGMSL